MDLFSFVSSEATPATSAAPELSVRVAEESPQVCSVSELTRAVRGLLEGQLGTVWVEGEVSNYRKQQSGHQYFTLKDSSAQLSCVLFARQGMWRKAVPLADGMKVIARGNVTVYEARGQYQLNVLSIQASGEGLLQAKFEALKRKLHGEGLFDADRKRPIPKFPRAIAIVTSPTGAALRDMLNVLSRRAPWLRVVICPARVQGTGAAEEITAALKQANAFESLGLPPVDLVVLARGGGSAEDLWEFNDESLARAIAASDLPVISAVGHEIDFTIADFAADLRAPTPSAAAELVCPDAAELSRHLAAFQSRFHRHAAAQFLYLRQRLASMERSVLFREPRARLEAAAQRLDLLADRLAREPDLWLRLRRERVQAAFSALQQHRPDQQLALLRRKISAVEVQLGHRIRQRWDASAARLSTATEKLRLVSPQLVLERGYTMTFLKDGSLARTAQALAEGDRVVTRFADGEIESEVVTTRPPKRSTTPTDLP